MGPLLDIILSLVVRGVIVLAVLNTTIALQGKLSEKTAQANMFNLTTTVSRIMSNDFLMVGYNAPGSSLTAPYFTIASQDTIQVTYWSPTYSNQRWVKYCLGLKSEMSATTNPRDRKLYRIEGTTPSVATLTASYSGADSLLFTYYDATGATTTTKTSIKSFKVYLVMATGEKVNSIYPAGEWTYRFFPSSIN